MTCQENIVICAHMTYLWPRFEYFSAVFIYLLSSGGSVLGRLVTTGFFEPKIYIDIN